MRPFACFLLYFAFALGSFDNTAALQKIFSVTIEFSKSYRRFAILCTTANKHTDQPLTDKQVQTQTQAQTHTDTHTHTLSLSQPGPTLRLILLEDGALTPFLHRKQQKKPKQKQTERQSCGGSVGTSKHAKFKHQKDSALAGVDVMWLCVCVCVCACVRDAIKNQGSAASTAAVSSEPDINWDHFYKEVHKTYKNSNQWHETNAGICFNCQAL